MHKGDTIVGEVAVWIASVRRSLERPLMYNPEFGNVHVQDLVFHPSLASLKSRRRPSRLLTHQYVQRVPQSTGHQEDRSKHGNSASFAAQASYIRKSSGFSACGAWIAAVNLFGQQVGWIPMSTHAIVRGGAKPNASETESR